MASVFNIALNIVLLTWLGLTLGLGTIGWIVGDRLSSRFPAIEEASEHTPASEEEKFG
jgi:hypothetical protein